MKWATCPSAANSTRSPDSTSWCCTPRAARCVGSRSRRSRTTTRQAEARARALRIRGRAAGGPRPGVVDRAAVERPAAMVAAIAVHGGIGLAPGARSFLETRRADRVDLRHRLVDRHVLVAV